MNLAFPRLLALSVALLLAVLPATASADRARVEALGAVDLLIEDSSDLFTNPALLGRYSDRVWISLGVTGNGGSFGFDPMGGAAIRVTDGFDLGVALNRNPTSYDFGNALWPVATVYLPDGPGGAFALPGAPAEGTAPLRFPVDVFFGFGRAQAAVRGGLNIYYAGGEVRLQDTDISETSEDVVDLTRQSHLVNVTFGLAARDTDFVRPEVWLRVGNLSSRAAREQVVGRTALQEGERIDRWSLALSADVRGGGGVRVHIGDPLDPRGVVLSPAVQYDGAIGWYSYNDDNLSGDAERTTWAPSAHHLRGGLGVAVRLNELRIVGTASVVAEELRVRQTQARAGYQIRDSKVELSLPELSLGAEYRVRPALLLRAGLRSAVVGGRAVHTTTLFEEAGTELVQVNQDRVTTPKAAAIGVEAHGGVALQVRRMTLDVTAGGAFLGQAGAAYFGRMDLSFAFR